MGLLLVVGAIIAAIAASGVGGAVAAGIERAICVSVGDGPCPTVAAQLAQDDDEEAGQDAQERERRELERARAEFKDVQARAMTAMAGSMRPLSEVQGQSPGDWVLGGLGELSGVNDADRGITQLGEGDIAGGAFSLAMAWPGAKAFKLGKEGIEEGIEQVTREGAEETGEATARRQTRPGGGRGGRCSFTGQTPVLMADGTHKAIELVRVGDEVIATDPTTGQRHPRAVMARWAHHDRTVRLTAGGETLTTTANHPFYSATDSDWQTARALDVGDRLATSNGHLAVQAISGVSPTAQTAYNLTVQHTHTYHVGVRSILVRNECIPADFAAPPVRRTPSGEVTNGRYTMRTEAQARHTTGSTTSGKSQFLFRVDADQAVLDASAYADDAGLWVNNRAKVRVETGPVGILGESGQPTNWVNLYRTRSGRVHGSPGRPP
jgi:hypothetical protein